jgi:hypothetical protein
MPMPRPEPGLVIGYSYLWRAEADGGAEDARKPRLSAVVFVTADEGGRTVNGAPDHASDSAPKKRCHRNSFSNQEAARPRGERSWVIVTEANEFVWPGPDLMPIGRGRTNFAYGYLPPALFRMIRDAFVANWRRGARRTVKRSE